NTSTVVHGRFAVILNRWFLVLASGMTLGLAVQGQEAEREAGVRSIKITSKPLCAGDISPLQYGQFVEYLCNLIPGMWAEKLYDGSFEGLGRYEDFKGLRLFKLGFLVETDFREKPWYPIGAVNRAKFSREVDNPVSGSFCQKIVTSNLVPCTA